MQRLGVSRRFLRRSLTARRLAFVLPKVPADKQHSHLRRVLGASPFAGEADFDRFYVETQAAAVGVAAGPESFKIQRI